MADTSGVKITKIDPDGDVILAIGSPASKKLLVSSETLGSASSVLNALFGPYFKEGQGIGDSTKPKEVELPDDNVRAVSDLCHLLHNKGGSQHFDASRWMAGRILELAIVVDKYDCLESLCLQSRGLLLGWFDQFPNPAIKAYYDIVAASYLLHQAKVFERATHVLLMKSIRPVILLHSGKIKDMLPDVLPYLLEQKRTAAFSNIAQGLPELGMPKCRDCWDGHYGSKSANYDQAYLDKVTEGFQVRFWPPPFLENATSIEAAVETIRVLGSIVLKNRCPHQKVTQVSTALFAECAQKVLGMCNGLCLTCVKNGSKDYPSKCEGH